MQPNKILENILFTLKKFIPQKLFQKLQPTYHYALAFINALRFRFPSRHIKIVAVTGTKGKTSTTEIIDAILREQGYKTAVINTIHFKIGDNEERNTYKMSLPGRSFVQRFIRRAVDAKCDWIVMEITSQAVVLHRHRFIELDALIFTNISPEHIESHGSFENYLNAKLKIAESLKASSKKNKVMVSNIDDEHGQDFLDTASVTPRSFTLQDAEPYELHRSGFDFTFKNMQIHSYLSGLFNIYNVLGAVTFADSIGIDVETIKNALEKFYGIRGRLELVNPSDKFEVYVDYAHTTDSLEKAYQAFAGRKIIGILGNTGGGRDTWKRGVMAEIAEKHCAHIIFANEDPYDEDPMAIVQTMYDAVKDKSKAQIVLDRREAIRTALEIAQPDDVILITGKGTDPYIMEADNRKTPWDDASVVREELAKMKK